MTNQPIFSEQDKAYLARFLGEEPNPTTVFEARVFLERAAAATDPFDANHRIVKATFLLWADDIDPQTVPVSTRAN